MSKKVNDVNDKKILSNLNDVNQKCEMNDVEKNLSPDRVFCGPESFGKEKMEKEMDLAGDVGESVVEGWGTWAEPGSGSKLQGEHGQSKIGQNKWRNRSTEPRENPSTMTSNIRSTPMYVGRGQCRLLRSNDGIPWVRRG
jgi:hypothetical protein